MAKETKETNNETKPKTAVVKTQPIKIEKMVGEYPLEVQKGEDGSFAIVAVQAFELRPQAITGKPTNAKFHEEVAVFLYDRKMLSLMMIPEIIKGELILDMYNFGLIKLSIPAGTVLSKFHVVKPSKIEIV